MFIPKVDRPDSYYCYMNLRREEIEAALIHREIAFESGWLKEELVRLLQDNDQDLQDGIYKPPCNCCPTLEGVVYGCENCRPHYFHSYWEKFTYYLNEFWVALWFGVVMGFFSGGDK